MTAMQMTDAEYNDQAMALWLMMFKYYNRPIAGMDDVIQAYVDDLSTFPIDRLKEAFKAYRANPDNKTIPLPAAVKALLIPGYGQANHHKPYVRDECPWGNDPDVDDDGNVFTPDIREANLRKIKKILHDAVAEQQKRWTGVID